MLFRDIPTVDPAGLASMLAPAKGIVFVTAKGIDGIKMPPLKVRDAVSKQMGNEVAFVPVTDAWKKPGDVLAKDLAMQLKQDTGSSFKVVLSVARDRYDFFADRELPDKFLDNAVVVLQPPVDAATMNMFVGIHRKTAEQLKGKTPRVFPEHIQTVMGIVNALPATPKVVVDAGGGLMAFDQAKHYLDSGAVSMVMTLNVALAKSEKMTIPYIWDNAAAMGDVDERVPNVLRVITRAAGAAAPALALNPLPATKPGSAASASKKSSGRSRGSKSGASRR